MTVPVVKVDIRTRASEGNTSSVYTTNILKYDIPLQEQMTRLNTKYIIKWNFDLEGGKLPIPPGCILEFDGGRISNGTIVWHDTRVLNLCGYTILENIREEGTRLTFGGEI